MAVVLIVALLAVATPGMQHARERATIDELRTDATELGVAIAAVENAPRGTRRVVTFELPRGTFGRAPVESVTITAAVVRYELASGRRGGHALRASTEPAQGPAENGGPQPASSNDRDAPAGTATSGDAGAIVLRAAGGHVLHVRRTADGVRITRSTNATVPPDQAGNSVVVAHRRATASSQPAERLSGEQGPRVACSSELAGTGRQVCHRAGVRRRSRRQSFAWTAVRARRTVTS